MKKVIFISSEAIPLAKTGGLADVCGVLPGHLQSDRYSVELVLPAYSCVASSGRVIGETEIDLAIPMGGDLLGARLLHTELADGTRVHLIDRPSMFHRDGLYGPPGDAYADNGSRFLFFCRAALRAIQRLHANAPPAILHCHDWQTALIPALIRADDSLAAGFAGTRSVLTIHNLAYQGHFDKSLFPATGLSWNHFNSESFEYYDGMNFLKTGILAADHLTTVSPTYADEICTPEFGCGLDAILNSRRKHLTGIVNGIDETVWNPMTDPHLDVQFGVQDWVAGKSVCREAIAGELELSAPSDWPMIGLVGRLAQQKGWDLILPMLRRMLAEGYQVRWAVLGSGDATMEQQLRDLRAGHPDRFGCHIGFSERLAHRIEAGADFFLMPSHYEPCGLNQLYSLRYGAVPIVTPTGGLADTVRDATPANLADRVATGFYVRQRSADGVQEAVQRAIDFRYQQPDAFAGLVSAGMRQDWSWKESARKYTQTYEMLTGEAATNP
ncbi:MAG: glycogen synthase GlgA [Planctomycetota bacterium]